MTMHWLTDAIAVGDAPTADGLARLPTAGVRSLVDLRSDGEPHPRGLPAWEERALAERVGLAYRQVPVEPQLLGDGLAYAVRDAVAASPAPVFLHCTSGRRAGTFGLALLATERDLDVDECFARGRALGLDWDGMPRLAAFLRRFVERHGRRYRAGAEPVKRRSGSG
ncbi:MAG TPA: sulfur transferase domain-containing protein [Candidatus Limnocylindria bacterium]|nr:sulfur transferase domain-containing protein [Candidatus Limnocylindria bacterium]